MAVTTTSLSPVMATYYERLLLELGKPALVLDKGAQKRTQSSNNGKTITFTRYVPLSVATTPLTEGDSGTGSDITATNISATLAEYGDYATVSKLLATTSIDAKLKGMIELFSTQMYETLDTLIYNALKATNTAQALSNKMTVAEVRKAVLSLKKNRAPKFSDGYYLGFVSATAADELMSDSEWQNPHVYKDTTNLYDGELGRIAGVRFLESTTLEAQGTTSMASFIVGKNAYGVRDLDQDKPSLLINGSKVESGKEFALTSGDKSDPLNRALTVGWAGSFVAVVLNKDWVIKLAK